MNTILLLLLAITPPAALMYLIYRMDRHEPESLKNVFLAMALGSLSIIPALIIEMACESIPVFTLDGFWGSFNNAFLLVAPSEELAKFFFIYLFIRKKPFYNEFNDGIVYYGAGALGFALLENIFYVFDNGFSTGVLRAFTSIPMHTFCGIIIGYHAGLGEFSHKLKPKRLIFIGIFFAYVTHAVYDTFALSDSLSALLIFPLAILILFAGYKVLNRGRQLSTAENNAANYRSEDIAIGDDGRWYLIQKKEKWKAVISRILLISTVLVWIAVFSADDTPPEELLDLVLGMTILTIIPFIIGLLLELSYQRRKRKKIYIDTLTTYIPMSYKSD